MAAAAAVTEIASSVCPAGMSHDDRHASTARHRERDPDARNLDDRARALLESFDDLIYLLTAAVFIVGAAAMLGYSVYGFASHAGDGFPQAVVALINDLLLVMIMMEVLKTILSYLEDHAISLRPFLFIGIISATRRVLTVGAGLAIESHVSSAELWTHLDDLLVNAAVILALAVAIRLVGQLARES